MNIINALLTATLMLPLLSHAAGKTGSDFRVTATTGNDPLQTQPRGASLISNSEQYQVLTGVRAAKKKSQELPQQTLSRNGGLNLIATKGAYVIFTATPQNVTSIVQSSSTTTYPTAINSRTGGIGIMPGTLNVKLKNMASAQPIANDFGLELVREFAHLNAAIYRIKAGQDVITVVTSLASDPRVESAEAEVIEQVKTAY